MYKIIDNCITKKKQKFIVETIIDNHSFPWYLQKDVSFDNGKQQRPCFAHIFVNEAEENSHYFNLIKPIINKLNILSLIRAKVNCFPKSEKLIKYDKHRDFNFNHKGAIYYLNTCDGGTYIGDKFIPSIENQILLFDSSTPHQSTNCTDEKCRFNININYF